MSPRRDSQADDLSAIFPRRGKRALVLCAGPRPSPELLAEVLSSAELFVCADGAGLPYEHLPRMPDLVIGDFDSLAPETRNAIGGPGTVQETDQSTTDSEKALLYVAGAGYEEAILAGATGWRLDHTLYNVHLLERFADRLRVCLVDPYGVVIRLDPESPPVWDLKPGVRFSLLPLSGRVTGVTLEGAVYPLHRATLAPGGPATISNRVSRGPLRLTVAEGSLLFMVNRCPHSPATTGRSESG